MTAAKAQISPERPHETGVAVIIAAYNSRSTIQKAIDSALADPATLEVAVIDDASTDDTADVARSCDDGSGRLKIFIQGANTGPAAARNVGIVNTSAPWITILDADDYFYPGRLDSLLHEAPKADFVADDLWQVKEDDEHTLTQTLLDGSVNSICQVSFKEFVVGNLSDRNKQRGELGFVKPIIRRSFLEKHDIRYNENMRLGEDYELYARSLAHGAKFILTPPKGYVSLWRNDSLSGRHTEADLLNLREADLHLMQIPSLSNADRQAVRNHYISVDCRLQWRLAINAVKSRSLQKFLGTFIRPWPVPAYILGQLINQLCVRALGQH
jgi:succinoglycan biosynthesis protein ExoU